MEIQLQNLLPQRLTKAAQAEAADRLTEVVQAGDASPLEATIALRNIREAVDLALDVIEPSALQEAARYHKNEATKFGVGFEVRQRSTHKYDHDPVWQALNRKVKAAQDLLKQRERQMTDAAALVEQGLPPVDGETGEEIPLPRTTTSHHLAILFPKQ